MKALSIGFVVLVSIIALCRACARWSEAERHQAWVRDQERRQQGRGIDGVCWSWPVKTEKRKA